MQRLEPRPREHPRVNLAWDELSSALRADHTTILHHDLAPQHGEDGPALDLPAFPDAVICNVEVRHAQYLMHAGVDEDKIRIAAWRNRTFPWVEAEQTRGVGRRHIDEMFQRHAALYDPFGVGDPYTRLRTVVPTSDVLNRLAGSLESVGSAVFISRHGVDVALEQTVPEGLREG